MTPEKIVGNFNRCCDWEERYLYLIELGERLPSYPDSKMTAKHLIKGCQSKVWLDLRYDSESGVLNFLATSDAAIVRGLLALLRIAYHGKLPHEVLLFDIQAWFEALDLKSHLTPGRTQGLEAIVKQVQTRMAD
ncbi:SufE family protein [Photobacterium sanguinicancri]|uniref:SufE family protein n=1 Tax=Photobacterium sanguinicancri TaxID=875932 RepID=UPI0026E3F94E|nr:SufE family protein [Photobacterium sanguinicancri]MDO6500451.1 SufE family protein [Photobacterium sanguinicancri]